MDGFATAGSSVVGILNSSTASVLGIAAVGITGGPATLDVFDVLLREKTSGAATRNTPKDNTVQKRAAS